MKHPLVTILLSKASARYCIPSLPMPFRSRLTIVNVYIKIHMMDMLEKDHIYIISFQEIGNILCTSISHLIISKVQSADCLCRNEISI